MSEATNYMREYRTDAEYAVTLPAKKGDAEIKIEISAVGGGRVGKSYVNSSWIYNLYHGGVLVMSGTDLRPVSGSVAATHEGMAVTLARYLSADAEVIAFGGGDADHITSQLTDAGRSFLAREVKRLSKWGHDSRHDV